MLKKLLCLVIMVSLGNIAVYAQQFPIMDQYLLNPASISPAFVGKEKRFEVFLTSRLEWTKVSGAPFVGSLNLDGKLNNQMGLGGGLLVNNAGPLKNLNINLSYAYHLKLAQFHTLSFGINATFYQNIFDLSNILVKDPNDPLLTGQNKISESYFNVGASLLYNWKDVNFFIAFPLLFNNRTFYSDQSIYAHVLSMNRNFFIYADYRLRTNSDWGAKFNFLYRKTQYSPASFDLCARACYRDLAWLGLMYRRNNIFAVTGGFAIEQGIILNYSYEFSPTAMMGKSYGTHEITLGFWLPDKTDKPSLKDYIQ